MKFNWATGIVVAILSFMGFILYFFIKMTTDNTYNHELVTENYYEKELEYQQKTNIEAYTLKENMQVVIQKDNKGIELIFPDSIKDQAIKGVVRMYRPSNEKLDFELPITTQNGMMLIPDEKLVQGRWNISVEYEINAKSYITSFNKIEY